MSTIRATYVQHGSSAVPNITLNASGQVIVASGLVSSGTFAAPSGTAAAPGVYFVGDADTGLYSPGANQVAISSSGVGRVFIDASGNVGAGTSSPAFAAGGGIQAKYATFSSFRATVGANTGTDFSAASDGKGYVYVRDNADLLIGTNNTERLRITSDGKVGLGTSTPSAALHVVTSGAGQIRYFDGAVTGAFGSFGSGNEVFLGSGKALAFTTNGITSSETRMTIDTSGRVLVGTSSSLLSYAGLQIKGDVDAGAHICLANKFSAPTDASNIGSIRFTNNAGGIGAIVGVEADGAWTAGSNYRSRLVFSTTKDNTASPISRFELSNAGIGAIISENDCLNLTTTTAASTNNLFVKGLYSGTAGTKYSGTQSFLVYTNGNVANSNNSYGAISDFKLKENIIDATSQWGDIKDLQVRKYNFKEGQTHTQIGLIAQEVELVSPGLVTESPDRDAEGNDLGTVTKSVNYSVLYMKAVKALQEAMERIETLEASNTDLLARVSALESA